MSSPELNSGSDTDKSMSAESDEDTEGYGQAITADQQAISRKDVPIITNTSGGSPKGLRTRGGFRVRRGVRTGGKNTRGGTAASNTDACVNMSHSDLLIPEADVEGIPNFVMPVELILDENTDHHLEYDGVEAFESMDISAILQLVDASL